jgi:hydrogenase-4 component E
VIDLNVAGALIDRAALLLLAVAFAAVLARRVDNSIRLLALQGVVLAGAAVAVAFADGSAYAWIAVVLTITVKAAFVPAVLARALRESRIRHEVDLVVPLRSALLLGIGLILVAFYVAAPVGPLGDFQTANALPAAVAVLLLGMLNMLTRRKALCQVIGLVTMENGLYLIAIAATRGLPLAVELGIAVDLAVGVAIMTVLARQIHHAFATTNTDRLRSLRG